MSRPLEMTGLWVGRLLYLQRSKEKLWLHRRMSFGSRRCWKHTSRTNFKRLSSAVPTHRSHTSTKCRSSFEIRQKWTPLPSWTTSATDVVQLQLQEQNRWCNSISPSMIVDVSRCCGAKTVVVCSERPLDSHPSSRNFDFGCPGEEPTRMAHRNGLSFYLAFLFREDNIETIILLTNKHRCSVLYPRKGKKSLALS